MTNFGKTLKAIRMWFLRHTKYRSVKIGKNVYIGHGSTFRKNGTVIGDHVSIGRFCQFGARNIRVGSHVMISSYVGIVDRNAHEARHVGKTFRETGPKEVLPVVIGDDVWIGFGVIILSGAVIGEGSIVASGSVVVDDVPPYSIVASPKAKVIGERFDRTTAEQHREQIRSSEPQGK